MSSGLPLLRAVPFLASTSALTFTVSEDLFMRALKVDPQLRPHANRILPAHVRAWLPGALAVVFGTHPLAIAAASANLCIRDFHVDLTGARYNQRLAAGFYLAGLAFSVTHFLFGVRALKLLFSMRNDTNVHNDLAKDNSTALKAWVHLNAICGVISDLPAWVCYFVAFVAGSS
ncbi:hypothetical protein F4779DRAFT_575760 [Xylariaceae sp. FL0662B]|nr:hypothetical protein F4779DRAFT_575760 [Xylariaceae sp. FL0662B]